MAGNTSTYRIIIDRRTNIKKFIKTVDNEKFNFPSLNFQKALSESFINKTIKIVKPLNTVDLKDGTSDIEYTFVDAKDWDMNAEAAAIIGRGMAELHNFCHDEYSLYSFWESEKKIATDMGAWGPIPTCPEKTIATDLRWDVFNRLAPYNHSQVKIPVHRDFKIHNILNDGTNFYLIDFDFAAIDNVGIEIISFLVDLYYVKRDINAANVFMHSYKQTSRIPINWSTVLNDYLVYMCCNTFPFYLRETIGESNFRALFDERNLKLHFAHTNKDLINENLSR
jgi:hypothetical protein